MNTCSTCRWWNGPTQPGYEDESGTCQLVGLVGKGFSLGIVLRANSHSQRAGDLILLTKPDFGCNQWEGKDE